MIQFLLAAPRSGSGKTTMTCALLMALKRRGCAPCAFKSGPDYIDPMFHRAVLGVESRSLDLFFSAPETVRTLYAKGAAGHGAAVCEGAMGFYDGLGGVSDRASAWHLADTLGLPVLLVVEPKGQSLTLAAELKGLNSFRTPSHIAGILLNNCTARMHALLAPMLEKETGLPVLGFLPKLPEAVIGSRHLGLYTAAEVENLQQKLALLADAAEEHIDWPRLLALCEKEPPALPVEPETPPARVRIAVAQDEAFCFTYAETLEAFRDAGAEVVFFSPLRDTALPENIGGLYLPGGYPELHARELSGKYLASARDKAKNRVRSAHSGRVRGLPLSGAEPHGRRGAELADGGRSAGRSKRCRTSRPLRLRRAERRLGQYALPGRGELSHPRIPPLGFHRQRRGSRGKKAGGRRGVAVRYL